MVVKETDLYIQTDRDHKAFATERVLYHRNLLENFIRRFPEFATTLAPWPGDEPRPLLIEEMIQAGRQAGVGPMAAVAGAIAECVGHDLLSRSDEVIVENGGDIFLKTRDPLVVGIYSGVSSIGSKLGIRSGGGDLPSAVCTSSGTIGHSLSFGRADAVCVLSLSCALADAAATAIGNRVGGAADIRSAVEWGREIEGVQGILIVAGDKVGAWGEVELVPHSGKKD